MRDFSKVSPSLWHSQRFNSLPSDDGRYLYLYLLTCEHQNIAGAFRLPDAYAASDLQWSVERYRAARADLEAADLIIFDAENAVVFIRQWFRFNPPMNGKHATGARYVLERLPSQSIWEVASAELEAALAAIAATKAKGASEGEKPASGFMKGNGSQSNTDPWRNWKPRP